MRPIDTQIDDYLAYCQHIRNMTAQTIQSKRYTLHQFQRETGIRDMCSTSNTVINNWITYQRSSTDRQRLVSARTINMRMKHIVCFTKWLRDMHDLSIPLKLGLIEHMKEDPPRRTFFTRTQIGHALAASDQKTGLMIRLAFDSGLRLSELQRIQLTDIDGRVIRVVGKGRKAARVYMTPTTQKLLSRYISQQSITDWLWPSPHSRRSGEPMHADAVRVKMARAFKKAGIKGFYPHSIRHSFATDIQRNGAPIEVTRELLRHTSIATTEVYLHHFNQLLQHEYDKWRTPRSGTPYS